MGRPGLAPGNYFRSLLVGCFEGIDSERGIAWRLADSLSLPDFLGLPTETAPPDHSTIPRTRRLIDGETHQEVFTWVLGLVSKNDLLKGKGRAMGGGKMGSTLLTGLLRCGICGGSCVVVSRRHKNGVTYANYGCTVNRSRGESICPNVRTVSEKKVTHAVIETLKAQLTVPAELVVSTK